MFLFFCLKNGFHFTASLLLYDSFKNRQKLPTPTQLCERMCGVMDSPVTADCGVHIHSILHKAVRSERFIIACKAIFAHQLVALEAARFVNSAFAFS